MEPVITAKGRGRKTEKSRSKQIEGEGKERRREGRGGEERERKENTLPPLPWIRNQFTTSQRHPPWPCVGK